jgi:antitoxin HicB
MNRTKKNPHWGSTLDDFLDEEGIREAAKAEAVTRVVAWQLNEEMKRQGMSKARLAQLMNTSRAQVDRILKAKGQCHDRNAATRRCLRRAPGAA